MRNENWKPIPGYEGRYWVSDKGRIYSNGKRKMIMNPSVTRDGYLSVQLFCDGQYRHMKVHRAVALAFIENPDNKETVNHKDCNKTNNAVENLEWSTRSEQEVHAYKNGKKTNFPRLIGTGNYSHKLDEDAVRDIRKRSAEGESPTKLAREYGVCRDSIYNVVNGYYWKDVK